jgi:folate-binding protein YgfZ
MDNWHSFLKKNGAKFSNKNEISFEKTQPIVDHSKKESFFIPLTHLGLIQLEGIDARQFLQGQVTCDVGLLSNNNSIFGAKCTPKGRTLTNFQLHEICDDKLLMIMHRSLIDLVIKDLSKYAAFYKVTLIDATELYAIFGLVNVTLDYQFDVSSSFSYKDGRELVAVSGNHATDLWNELSKISTVAGYNSWETLNIQSGIPILQKETSGSFVPQMLNLDYLDAISFSKGCYTGQEVVARMRYLGKLKRKMYRINRTSNQIVPPGTPCYVEDINQISGYVISSVQIDSNFQELLAVLTDQAAVSQHMSIGNANIEKVQYLPLSYIKS